MKYVYRFIILLTLGLFLSLNIVPLVQAQAQRRVQNQLSPLSLVQLGKKNYHSGKYSEGLKFLQKAQNIYGSRGNLLNQAQVLNWISLTYQQLGDLQKAETAIDKSLSLLEVVPKDSQKVRAQVLNTQGRLQFITGKAQTALDTWKQAQALYKQTGDEVGVIGSQINQVEAMQSIGLYNRAQSLFRDIRSNLNQQSDSSIKIAGLRNLGSILRQTGNFQESRDVLLQALLFASKQEFSHDKSAILLSLGNTARFQKDSKAALDFYQRVQKISNTSPMIRIQAQLNQLSLLRENKLWKDAEILSQQIPEPLASLSVSRAAIFAQIKLAKNLVCLQQKNSTCSFANERENQISSDRKSLEKKIDNSSLKQEINLLNTAYKKSKELQDKRTESYVLGNLGKIYESNLQYYQGLNYTKQALKISQEIQAADLNYQWFWQQGRLLNKQKNPEESTTAYLAAIDTLRDIRRDLVSLNPDIRFNFRDEVEPVYRQTVNLLLQPGENKIVSQKNLNQARNIIESLQLAELDNFFRAACIQPKVEIDQIIDTKNATAAVIYPILLEKQLKIILKLPQQESLQHYTIPITQKEVEKTVTQLRESLIDVTATSQVKKHSQQLYNWLIQPLEKDLITSESEIKTLVFVLDGELRNIPMAVLYNRPEKKYLMEKYNIALTPGLQLVEPKPLQQVKLRALIAGVEEKRSVEGKEFPSLPNLFQEVSKVKSAVSQSQELLNQKFTKTNLTKQIKSLPFSIIHLATHGQFSSNPDNTFILTWDKLIKARELDNLLKVNDTDNSANIELLVLSACKTAQGDKRAALGLAGVALRAGARSTLATLWTVDDESTSNLMSYFYQELSNGVSKAEALHKAQLKVFEKEKRPYFWAPYILVGNWL